MKKNNFKSLFRIISAALFIVFMFSCGGGFRRDSSNTSLFENSIFGVDDTLD